MDERKVITSWAGLQIATAAVEAVGLACIPRDGNAARNVRTLSRTSPRNFCPPNPDKGSHTPGDFSLAQHMESFSTKLRTVPYGNL
eukprot:scaffold104604_cov52-Prasinocladus_malaysianus.AAC.2